MNRIMQFLTWESHEDTVAELLNWGILNENSITFPNGGTRTKLMWTAYAVPYPDPYLWGTLKNCTL